jgi:hypothetical protein
MNQPSKGRRQLLRGSAAVPVVLTVQSGAALAATSSQCAVRAETLADPTSFVTAAPDVTPSIIWYRVAVFVFKISEDGIQLPADFVKWGGDNSYWKVSQSGVAVNPPTLYTPPLGKTIAYTQTSTTVYALAQVNNSGAIVGYSWMPKASGAYKKTTQSCWTSLK